MSQNPADGGPPQDGEPGWQSPSGGQPQSGAPQSGPPQYGPPQYLPPPQSGPPQYQPPPGYAPPAGYQPPPRYATPGFGQPLADKPGIIPLRPLAVGELLDGTFAAIRMNPKALLGLSFVIVLVGQLAVLGLSLAAHDASTGARLSVTLGSLVVTQLVTSITTGAVVVVISEAVLGTRIAPADALNRLRGRVWRLVGLGLLVSLLTLLAAVVLVIPGIYVLVLLSLATPVFILEKTTVRAALSRSAELVRGAWWRTFGIGFLGYLVGGVISGIVQVPFTLFVASSSNFLVSTNTDVSTGDEVLLAIGRILGGTISTPIIAGTLALLYIDRRMRREGLDLVLAQTARQRQGRS